MACLLFSIAGGTATGGKYESKMLTLSNWLQQMQMLYEVAVDHTTILTAAENNKAIRMRAVVS